MFAMFIIPSCGFYFTFEQPLKTETTDRFKLLTGPNSRNASASKTAECRSHFSQTATIIRSLKRESSRILNFVSINSKFPISSC